jgi:hypothetical protein
VTTESNCDPSGGGIDPSGGGCVPFGNMKLIEVSMNPPPEWARTFYIEAMTDPSGAGVPVPTDEASVSPEALVFDDDLTCVPQSVWVTGENDNLVDGNQFYRVRILDEQDFVVDTIPGINLDNDNYSGVYISTSGPNALPVNGNGMYEVRVVNISSAKLNDADLIIEPSEGLAITGFAAELVSGGKFKSKGSTKTGNLVFKRVDLDARDTLLIVMDVVMIKGGMEDQKIIARFEPSSGLQVDDDQTIRTTLP